MNVTFNNPNITNSQVGEKNVMKFFNGVLSEKEWEKLETKIKNALNEKCLNQEEKELLENYKKMVNSRNESGIRAFLKKKGTDFLLDTCSNILGSEAVSLLTRFF